MNALAKAIDHCKYVIPREVLEAIFIRRDQQFRNQPMTIDAHLMNEVIRPRVFVDCNLMGGTEMFVPLHDIAFERINNYTSVYRIPKSKTQGRSIMSVLNITFADPTAASNYGAATGCGSTEMLTTAQAMVDSMGTIPISSTAQVQLVGENTVMVRDTVLLPANVYLRCVVANDETMSHLQLRSYRHFYKLVELAVKSYIYHSYAIMMDMGELYGGQTLGRFKEFVDSYADAEELYQTYLVEQWQKVSFMNDNESFSRYTRLLTGGRR